MWRVTLFTSPVTDNTPTHPDDVNELAAIKSIRKKEITEHKLKTSYFGLVYNEYRRGNLRYNRKNYFRPSALDRLKVNYLRL